MASLSLRLRPALLGGCAQWPGSARPAGLSVASWGSTGAVGKPMWGGLRVGLCVAVKAGGERGFYAACALGRGKRGGEIYECSHGIQGNFS